MKKIFLGLFLLVVLFLPTSTKAVSFDDSVLKATVQIQIWDTYTNTYISWGTGISLGGFNVITNYHVAKLAITDPNRYKIYACVTESVNGNPDCRIKLSTNFYLLGRLVYTPKYDENADLALLYTDQFYFNGAWHSYLDTPSDEQKVGMVYLANYINNYQDLALGDHVYSIGYPDYGGGKTIQVDGTIIKKIVDPKSNLPLAVSDFKISFGNSGGPVFNANGKLVGVTVQCFTDSNKKCVEGIFIPLPTLNWWYMNATNSHIFTLGDISSYSVGDPANDDVGKSVLCDGPNGYYDKINNKCACNTGFSFNSKTGCVDSTGYVDPTLRYGQSITPSPEKLPTLDNCKAGYKLNEANNYCIIADDATNPQKCEYHYGINSVWGGSLDDKGEPVCGCVAGFEMNGKQGIAKMCALINEKAVDVKKPKSEIKTIATTSDKTELSVASSSNNQASTSVASVKPKSWWAKVFGWFGF